MSNVINFKPKKHIYEIDQCKGCNVSITDEYVEVKLYSHDDKVVNHIGLCNRCNEDAKRLGVL